MGNNQQPCTESKRTPVYNLVILDKSGSMSSISAATYYETNDKLSF